MSRKVVVFALVVLMLAFVSLADAQQPGKVPRIGFLANGSPSSDAARIEAFRQGLRELGYVEGQNIVIEYRYGEGKTDRFPDLATELDQLKVDVIVVAGATATSVVSPTFLYNSVRPDLVEGLSIFNNLRSWFDKLTTNDE